MTFNVAVGDSSEYIIGTNQQFLDLRAFLNSRATGKVLRVEMQYTNKDNRVPTLTNFLGFIEFQWHVPDGMQVPFTNRLDTYARTFSAAYSDQSGAAEHFSLTIRPGAPRETTRPGSPRTYITVGTRTLSRLPAVIRIYGVQ